MAPQRRAAALGQQRRARRRGAEELDGESSDLGKPSGSSISGLHRSNRQAVRDEEADTVRMNAGQDAEPADSTLQSDMKFLERNAQLLGTPFTISALIELGAVDEAVKGQILEKIPKRTLATSLKRVNRKVLASRQLFHGRKSRRALALHLEAMRQETAASEAGQIPCSSFSGILSNEHHNVLRSPPSQWKVEDFPAVWPSWRDTPSTGSDVIASESRESYARLRQEVADLTAIAANVRIQAVKVREVASKLRQLKFPVLQENVPQGPTALSRHLDDSRQIVAKIREVLERSLLKSASGRHLLLQALAREQGETSPTSSQDDDSTADSSVLAAIRLMTGKSPVAKEVGKMCLAGVEDHDRLPPSSSR